MAIDEQGVHPCGARALHRHSSIDVEKARIELARRTLRGWSGAMPVVPERRASGRALHRCLPFLPAGVVARRPRPVELVGVEPTVTCMPCTRLADWR